MNFSSNLPNNPDIPLENPCPPSSSASSLSTHDSEDDELMIAASGSKSSRIVRVYNLLAGVTPLQFLIAIIQTPNKTGHFTFSLSFKVGGVHRSICKPVTLRLTFDPRDVEFSVFIFPPNSSLPKNALYSLRVWLRRQQVDHRIFSEDSLWIGTDLDFQTVPDAKIARHVYTMPDQQIYEAVVGRAAVMFIVRWKWLKDRVFSFSFEYEAGGVGRVLFENLVLRLDCLPQEIYCHIYTIPLRSRPPGASHRLRVWLKSPCIFNSDEDLYQSYIYQRVWTTDDFKVGGDLDFREIDRRVVVGQLVTRPDDPHVSAT